MARWFQKRWCTPFFKFCVFFTPFPPLESEEKPSRGGKTGQSRDNAYCPPVHHTRPSIPPMDKPPEGRRSRNRVLSSIFRGHHSRVWTCANPGPNEVALASKDAHSRGSQGCTGSHPPRALTSPCALTRPTKKEVGREGGSGGFFRGV